MGCVGVGIEGEVGETVTLQMLGRADARGEDDARGVDASGARRVPHAVGRALVGSGDPEPPPWLRRERIEPCSEDGGPDLERVGEGASTMSSSPRPWSALRAPVAIGMAVS